MGHRCCSKQKVRRGLWSPEEDEKLVKYITTHGHGSWSSVPKFAGLQRCGKSCRLRWINYLRPDVRRGSFSAEEEQIIIDVHRILGNRWAQIAKHLPGRTDNEVKNFWNSCIKKKLISQGLDPKTHNMIPSHQRAAASNHHKVSSNIGATQSEHVQQPFSITNIVNSHSHTFKEANSNTETKPPTLTLPAAVPSPVDSMSIIQPSLLQTMSMPISSSSACGHQNPDANWAVDSHNSHDSTIVPWFSSTPQNTPISLVNPYGGFAFNDLDENSFWGNNINNAVAQPSHVANNNFQEAIRLQEGMQLQDQEIQPRDTQTISSTLDTADQLEAKGGGHHQENMDASFDCSSFDLELVDSTLLSSSMYPYGLSSMDDFAWNF